MLNLFSNILLFHSSTGKDEKKLKYSADLVVPAKALSLALALSLSRSWFSNFHRAPARPALPLPPRHEKFRRPSKRQLSRCVILVNHEPPRASQYIRRHTLPHLTTSIYTPRGSWSAYAFFAPGSSTGASPSLSSTGSSGPSGGTGG